MFSKKEIRLKLIGERKKLTNVQVITKSTFICNKIINSERYNKSKTIFCYYSINNEVDLKILIDDALKHKKNVALPKIENNNICFYLIKSLDELKPGYYKIPEPDNTMPAPTGDLLLVPGVAFTEKGERLGYGGGFYDRFLEHNNIYSIGICYDFQIVKELPIIQHDKIMNEIISD